LEKSNFKPEQSLGVFWGGEPRGKRVLAKGLTVVATVPKADEHETIRAFRFWRQKNRV